LTDHQFADEERCAARLVGAELGNSWERKIAPSSHKRLSFFKDVEAPPGFEPGVEVLQISIGSLSCWNRLALWSLVFVGFRWCSGVRGLKLD